MALAVDDDALATLWQRQSVWSQAANQLKRDLRRARLRAAVLAVSGAILGTASAQLAAANSEISRTLAVLAAVALALAPVLGRPAGTSAVRDWTRARSVAEALKTEVYTYLAGVAPFRGLDRQRVLLDHVERIQADARDLTGHAAGITPVRRPAPEVHDVDSYIAVRVNGQIDGYYRRQAAQLRRTLSRLRQAETALAALAAALAAVAGFFPAAGLSAWVGVVTTIGAAVAAHVGAERYDYQQIEFTRTADELEDLRSRYLAGARMPEDDDAFVAACERIISIQNEGWMAKLAKGEQTE